MATVACTKPSGARSGSAAAVGAAAKDSFKFKSCFDKKSVIFSSFYGENVIIPSHSSISRLNKSVVSPHVRYDGLLAPQLLSRTLKDSLFCCTTLPAGQEQV